MNSLWTVILAGGVGSRFWPASTPERPKQILPLASDAPLLADTLGRIAPLVPLPRIRVLTGAALVEPILEAIPAFGQENLWIEPAARGTAPVLVWAAHRIAKEDPDAVMVSLHADHVIDPASRFRDLVRDAARLAQHHNRLFLIGIEPTRAEPGYGYIKTGTKLDAAGTETRVLRVDAFREKPDRATAETYVASGDFLWNSGLFVWRVADLLDQIREHTPEIAEHLPLLDEGDDGAFFTAVPNLSIDEGLLERSSQIGVVRSTFAWDDVGTWDALARTRPTDNQGNAAVGGAHWLESHGSVSWADRGTIIGYGVENLVIVREGDITLVMPREKAADLKRLVHSLPQHLKG